MLVENSVTYKGLKVITVFTKYGYRCGYVFLPTKSDLSGLDPLMAGVDVHGGLTYGKVIGTEGTEYPVHISRPGIIFGFDCHHYGDGVDSQLAMEHFGTSEYVHSFDSYPAKSAEYVLAEAVGLAHQLKDKLDSGTLRKELSWKP